MFGKKKCFKCERKIEKDFEFCPFCGNPQKQKDYGFLGESDNINELDKMFNNSFADKSMDGSFMDKIFSGTLNSAMKIVEKEMRQMNGEDGKMRESLADNPNSNVRSHFELFINGKKVNLPGNIAGVTIENMPSGVIPAKTERQTKARMPKISEEILKKASKLPRKEAKSRISRTADKVIYELETPGINSLNEVLINKLESSIEIKAFTDKVVFTKNLPVKLPLMQYGINPSEGKLVLEFKAQ